MRKKIEASNIEIESIESKIKTLNEKDPEKLKLLSEKNKMQDTVCGCKEALITEERLLNSHYAPTRIGKLTTFGYCLPLYRLYRESDRNPDWFQFDNYVIDKQYVPVIDVHQENIEKYEGGMFTIETEKSILDKGLVASWLWARRSVEKLSNPGARSSMPAIPDKLLPLKQGGFSKRLVPRKRNLYGRVPKPSYNVLLNAAFNMRFDWSEFANSEGLNPNETVMEQIDLRKLHYPELIGLPNNERDSDAAYLISEAAKKGAKISLSPKLKGHDYSNPFPKGIVKLNDHLEYYIDLPDSNKIIVDSPNYRSETVYSLPGQGEVSHGDALGIVNDAWKKEVRKMNAIREKYRGRF